MTPALDAALRLVGLPVDHLDHLAIVLGLSLARLAPIFVIAPFFGGRHLPVPLRVAISLAVLLLIAPPLAAATPADALVGLGAPALVLLALKELAIGVLLGFLVSVPFVAARAAGAVAMSDEGGSRFADLALLVAVVVFFGLNGHLLFLRAVAASYEAIPLAGMPSAGAIASAGDLALAASAQLILAALGLAAPVLVARLLSEIALALVARAGGPALAGAGAGAGGALAAPRTLVAAATWLLSLGAFALAVRGELGAALSSVARAIGLLH